MLLSLFFAAGLFAQKIVIIPDSVVPLNGTPTLAIVTRFPATFGELDLIETVKPDATVTKPIRNNLGFWIISTLAQPPVVVHPTSAGEVSLVQSTTDPNSWCQAASDTKQYYPNVLKITVTITSPAQPGTSGTVSWPPQIYFTPMQPGPQPTSTPGVTIAVFPTWSQTGSQPGSPTGCGTLPGISLAQSNLVGANPQLINFAINSVEILAVW